jgi:[ribosomal protein S18]-alanine N-acetyltransferase
MRQRLIEMRVYVAVTAGGEIIGTIASSLSGDEAHLRGMAVCPQWQGKGIAEQLLLAAEADLLAVGCARVTLDTTVPLERAISFYRKHGFLPTGRITDFFAMPLYEYAKPLR